MPGASQSHVTGIVDVGASQKDRHHRPRKTVLIHQVRDPMPKLDDFLLFPKENVDIEKFSTVKAMRRTKRGKSEKARPENNSRCIDQSIHREYSDISSENDREGRNGDEFAEAHYKEPPAPAFARLPTPDFVDDDGLDFWSCCASTRSTLTDDSKRNDTEDVEEGYLRQNSNFGEHSNLPYYLGWK